MEFQEVYEIMYPSNRDIKEDNLYSYFTDKEYFNYLNDEYANSYCKRFNKGKNDESNQENRDEDGFIEVKTKKKHRK